MELRLLRNCLTEKNLKMYPVKLWQKIRTEYESGKYTSIEDMYDKLRKNYDNGDFPGCDIIKLRCTEEKWQKAMLQQSLKEKFREAFLKRNFDEAKVAEIVTQMSTANRQIPTESGVVDVDDWHARDKALTQYAKLCGAYAPEQIQIVTIDKIKIVISHVAIVINKYVPADQKQFELDEIAKLLDKLDG